MKRRQKIAFWWAAFLTASAALLYCSWPLGFWLNPAAMRAGLASELGAYGQPYNWVFIWGDIISGALLLWGAIVLIHTYKIRGAGRWSLILLATYGVCGALDAALPMSCLPSQEICGPVLSDPMLILHGAIDLVGSVALVGTLVEAVRYVHKHNRTWRPWIYFIGVSALLFAVLSGVFYVFGGPGYWAQRYYITLSCIWVASIPFVLKPRFVLAKVTSN